MLHPDAKLKNLAITIYGNIQDHFNEREPMKEGKLIHCAPQLIRSVIVNRNAEKPGGTETASNKDDPLASMFSENVGSRLSTARTYHLYIKGPLLLLGGH